MIAINQRIREQRRPSRRFILSKVGECLYRSECGSYFAVVKHLGKQHRRSLQTKDRAIAAKKLVEFRQKLNRLAPAADHAATITFDQLAKRWLDAIEVHLKPSTHLRRCGVVKVGLRRFRKKPANKISKLDCERWATSRSKQTKGRTFNYELETLCLIFKYGISHGLLPENPAAGIRHRRLDTAAVLVPTREQFRMLVADMRQRTRQAGDWIEFLGYSGCRSGEAAAVCWKNVDWDRKTMLIDGGESGTKNHESRVIPLFPPLERLLGSIRASLRREPRPEDKILTNINAKWALKTACKRLGLRWTLSAEYARGSWAEIHNSRVISCYKPVVVLCRKDEHPTKYIVGDLLHCGNRDKKFFAWQQDVETFEQIIHKLSDPGQLVVDPCSGTGTTGIAAINLGRRFIGCEPSDEKPEKLFSLATMRLHDCYYEGNTWRKGYQTGKYMYMYFDKTGALINPTPIRYKKEDGSEGEATTEGKIIS